MKAFSYLVCVLKGHVAYLYMPWGDVNVFNFCRRCGQRTRDFHTGANWYEVEEGEKNVSPLY